MAENSSDFIRDKVRADVAAGKHGGKVATRFPPEPNGYAHIGHAKSICLNFGLAQEFAGTCNLRMDDTNPTTEDPEYVAAMERDVKWLGFTWNGATRYASDYYPRLYEIAEELIRKGRAYVCDLTDDQITEYRGTVGSHGKNSPFRDRSVDENLDLFRRMRAGEFVDGSRVLRAKIDMASPNMKMRDPPLYRIKHAHHYRTGDAWCIYPLYDFAHCLSDSIEGITHSICTLEFESARELYDWVIAAAEMPWVSKQTEFARLNMTYTVMSKRRLLQLVNERHVNGWDDPRMPTIAGMRRRGYTPEAIRNFCARIGVARNLSLVDVAVLEHAVREDLDQRSPRVLGVLRPLPLTIENYPEGDGEVLDAPYWPHDVPKEGSRKLPFSRDVLIDRDDFMVDPPKDFHRLAPGKSVRLRHGYIVTCTGYDTDVDGNVTHVRATYDAATRGGSGAPPKGTGTIQWVSARHARDVEVRLYDRLFTKEIPGEGDGDFKADLNPHSLTVLTAKVEPSVVELAAGTHVQLERVGYFYTDQDSSIGAPILNRVVALKDGWAKTVAKNEGKPVGERRAKEQKSGPAGQATALSPEARALVTTHQLADDEARAIATEPALAALFADGLAAGAKAKPLASLLANDVLRELRAAGLERAPFGGAETSELLALVADGTLSNKLAKDVLAAMFAGEGAPRAIVEKHGLRQVTDTSAIEAAVSTVLAANADAVARYRAGNANVLGALVGLTIKQSGGKANPKAVTDLLKKALG